MNYDQVEGKGIQGKDDEGKWKGKEDGKKNERHLHFVWNYVVVSD